MNFGFTEIHNFLNTINSVPSKILNTNKIIQTQTECVPEDSANAHHIGWNIQNLDNPTSILEYSDLKEENNSLRFRSRSFFRV